MSTPRISNLENSFSLCGVFHEYAYKVEDKRLTPYYLYRGDYDVLLDAGNSCK